MSWWVSLEDRTAKHWCSYGVPPSDFVPEYEGDVPCPVPCYPDVEVEAFEEGGTYVLGGSTQAELNVTYNYSKLFWEAMPDGGLRGLDERHAEDCISILEQGVEHLSAMPQGETTDYWAATPGNAVKPLKMLLEWAKQHPKAVFSVN